VFEVLVYLYENYAGMVGGRPPEWPDAEALTRKLSAVGFEEDEISAAIDWLQGLARVSQAAVSVREARPDSFRSYAGFEVDRLGHEAVAFLSFLEVQQQLSAAQREIVIERSLAMARREDEWPMPLAKLKLIVLMVLWSQQADIDVLLLEELLDDGDQRLLH
jgi:Smg protein